MKVGFKQGENTLYYHEEVAFDGYTWYELPNDFDTSTHRMLLDNGNLVKVTIEEFDFLTTSAIPRILSYQIDNRKDFRAVDLNSELTISLDSEEVYGQLVGNRGLLLKKKYTHNGIDILFIDYDYQFNSINEITHQRTILYWYNENGQINDLIKDKGWVKLSSKDRTIATVKRREAIIGQLKDTIKLMMSQNANNDLELNASIDYGNSLIAHVSNEIDIFTKSGKSQLLINKLDSSVTLYPFLLDELAPNFTVIDYINNFLNY